MLHPATDDFKLMANDNGVPPAAERAVGDSEADRREAIICQIRATISSTLGKLVEPGTPALFWDFTEHPNVGDSLLLLGELAWLAKNCRTSSFGSISAPSFRKAQSNEDAIVMLHGGGNFGDLWYRHDELRRRVVRWAKGRRVVVFPQTVALRNREKESIKYLDATMRDFTEHGDAHIMARDSESYELLSRYDVHVEICPDMAFFLGPLPPIVTDRSRPLCILSRADTEKLPESLLGVSQSDFVDWISPRLSDRVLIQLGATLLSPPRSLKSQTAMAAALYERHALRRVLFGAMLIARGQVLVSDRLHANILALLQGKKSVAVHDVNQKIARVLGTWIPSELHPPFVETFREGIVSGKVLVDSEKPRVPGISISQLRNVLQEQIDGWCTESRNAQ